MVLAVSTYPYVAQLLRDIFETAGYDCFLASNGYSGLRLFCETRPPLIVSDLRMLRGDLSGVDLLLEARKRDPDVAVVLLTGDRSGASVIQCLKLGAFKVLRKPVEVDELLLTAERALERRELVIERRLRLYLNRLGFTG
jgi:DNA-binding NtrC family response regulator